MGIAVGQMVLVPFGSREVVGYVMRLDPLGPGAARPFRLKAISKVLVPEPLFGPELPDLVDFISWYYIYPPGLSVKEILPGGLSPKIRASYKLTEEGHSEALAQGENGSDAMLRLLECYPGALPVASLESKAKELRVLLKNDWAQVVYDIDDLNAGFSYEWYLAPKTPPAEAPRLGPKEKALYALVKDAPPTPIAHYRQLIDGNLMPQSKSLARKGLITIERRERFRDDPSRALSFPPTNIDCLTEDQIAAVTAINEAIEGKEQKGFLLFGVTGSGKTEVYLRAAEKALGMGQGVLWLAPEIALTLGLECRLKERFPNLVYSILHSALTPGQRHDHWVALRRGESKLALGARSAIFAPMSSLGLIIVDEEHDWAYKQDDGLKYHGRDLAAWRAQKDGAVLVLGSATPSLESYQRSLDGKLELLTLKSRPGLAVLPEVKIVDLREEGKMNGSLAAQVRVGLRSTFERGEQALIFLNRRGLANLPMCLSCGEVLKCPHCSLSLTLHSNIDRHGSKGVFRDGQGEFPEEAQEGGVGECQAALPVDSQGGQPAKRELLSPAAAKLRPDNLLVCHGCGYRAKPKGICPKCKSPVVRYIGVGTESLALEIEKNFGKKGLRLDTDSARLKGGLKSVLEGFSNGEADFLVGTQMAAKGHDFSNLTMVGVVEADIGLNLADFRAAERTFQLLSQVSGRAGRREMPGTVYIQTRNPRHYAMTTARDHDYEEFFRNESLIRKELGYPPFSRMALIRLSGPELEAVEELAKRAANLGREIIGPRPDRDVEFFGPAPSPMSKLRDKYRQQMMLRADKASERHRFLREWLPVVRKMLPKNMALIVDVDPYNLM
jgi:primosomal protein N' (replication factor Y)